VTLRLVALADFGSTFTKLTLVEAGSGRCVASSAAPTTVNTDVMEGYAKALADAARQVGTPYEIVEKLAASSAGGGLRVAAIGLVGDYTAAAARQAALNAGAKVEMVLSEKLGTDDLKALEESRPDIMLFSGGTDGGQQKQILESAEALANAQFQAHVIVACNNTIADQVADKLHMSGHQARVVANVLPEIDRLDIEPARAAIRDLFIEHVITGKGLSGTDEFGAAVIMPTPEAVLIATQLLSTGPDNNGRGNVMVADIGGATTDVHSAITLNRLGPGITAKGLPPLPLARSVQGDLGMRWSAPSVLDADRDWLLAESGCAEIQLSEACKARRANPAFLARDGDEPGLDRLLATACLTHAIHRHCGRLSTVYIPGQGSRFVQDGLDLCEMPLVIGTGGMLARDDEGDHTLARSLERREKGALTPRHARVVLDRSYILAAAGLLASIDRKAAYHLMISEMGL
jgi:uncharacterized protein (TIGR01319 family)